MSTKYWLEVQKYVNRFLQESKQPLETAAEEIFQSLRKNGIWHLFGSGHSALVVAEAFHRAGGLVQINPITEVEMSPFVSPATNREQERSEGKAAGILAKHSVQPGEVIWIISNSGINPASIDMALAAKAKGLRVWAVTCVEHSQAAKPRHSSGKRLYEIADMVLNTVLPPGDAILEFSHNGELFRAGAASLVLGSVLIHSVEARIVEKFLAAGLSAPVYKSANMPGGDKHNAALEQQYEQRILRMRE